MPHPNLGYLFWRECYEKGRNAKHIDDTITRILKIDATDEPVNAPHGFALTTRYPGLLIGSGYAHGLPVDEDVKIGFYFDHTSGLPVIPGSSVKGVLRNLFGLPQKGKSDPYASQKAAMICQILGKHVDVKALATAIFEGVSPEGKPLGAYRRDIFYDARIIKTQKALMADDYLAPHPNVFENPVPIRFLKVAPGVSFYFAFRLVDTTVGEITVTADEKERLFAYLLSTFGVGAKTNVGYGAFEPFDMQAHRERKAQEARRQERRRLEETLADASDAKRIAAEIETTKSSKILQQNIKKKFAHATLSKTEADSVMQKLEEKFGSQDKFIKKIRNFLKERMM